MLSLVEGVQARTKFAQRPYEKLSSEWLCITDVKLIFHIPYDHARGDLARQRDQWDAAAGMGRATCEIQSAHV